MKELNETKCNFFSLVSLKINLQIKKALIWGIIDSYTVVFPASVLSTFTALFLHMLPGSLPLHRQIKK